MGKRAITRRGSRRRPLGPLALGGLGLAVVTVLGGAVFAFLPGAGEGPSRAGEITDVPIGPSRSVPTASASPKSPSASSSRPAPGGDSGSGADSSPGAGSGEASPSVSGTPSASRSSGPPAPPPVPVSGPGTFTTARTEGSPVGSGPLRRYRVQVEKGIDISAAEAAAEIERILAHPRGWAAHGRGSFQLVSSKAEADFVIRIATPATADRLCLAQGLNTRGELNCETVDGVVVNLRRWVLGSPTFDGPAAEYRHLIINHEVGHEIGIHHHLGCSGQGRLAPVMMQQIKGLDGCVSNAWPYGEDGTYITGPRV
ncbi:DUF3152 domain-containing protein [Streptomyces sp. NPDC059479]|uniref:DUF3152 domain-containing protein n=1 Tax=Streptomyces sp. NPDC059479 TaxID=3346848 RepID=UPI0036AC2FCC